jgi:hypothetical protein
VKNYYSGYIETDCDSNCGKIYKGKYFNIYFNNPRQSSTKHFTHKFDSEGKEVVVEGKEALIQTSSIDNAIKASELVNAALTLTNESALFTSERPSILPLSIEEQKFMLSIPALEIEMRSNRIIATSGVLLACQIACKASFRRAYYNALLKYQLGNYLFSIAPIDLDPYHSPYYKLSPFPSDYVKFAYAIIAFYSVIEELGFGIKASEKNQSFINGKWNPTVREDLEGRLQKGGINTKDLFSWNLRSTPTNIERYLRKKGKLKPVKKSSWARGDVRDSEIELVDAILLVSNLRSSISSHKFSKFVESLSIYDVSNANYLAIRLLREKLGFWR